MELINITGKIAHIAFRNPENTYTVLKITPDGAYPDAQAPDGTLTVVGNLPHAPNVGETCVFMGGWVANERYGTQFKALAMQVQQAHPQAQPQAPQPPTPAGPGDQLVGRVERITYYNDESGWGVIKIDPADDAAFPDDALAYDGTIAVVGIMPNLIEGESAQFTGKWVVNQQYGRQFKADTAVAIAPKDEQGIIRYLADTVSGIGTRTAQRIYDHFGADTLNILDANPERVRDVPGLKPNLADNLIEAWRTSERANRQVMIHLQSFGISSRLAKKIADTYGPEAVLMVESDPYQLADDIQGIGFKKADEIARALGIAPDAPQRLRAGLVYTLSRMTRDGHTFAPRAVLIENTRELLGVQGYDVDLDEELREQILAGNLKADVLPVGDDPQVGVIYLPRLYNNEMGAAQRLKKMAETPSRIFFKMKLTDWEAYLAELAQDNNVNLSDEQQSAVRAAMLSKLSVLTGGPGTGKTTTLRMVINALDREEFSYVLASPTGRAAKRLQEATEREAKTIHRLLGWNPMGGGFEHDDENPLDTDFVIIDEASMIDLMLFNSLLKAIRPSSHLMLVGDIDQLPSVGAGNVLNDVIHSGIVHVTRLNQIFRQDENSHIVTNAHRINHGQMPHTDNDSKDFFFFNMENPEDAAEMIVDLVGGRLERKVGAYDPFNDVQVIAPMYRGAIGVNALNEALQDALNSGYHLAEKRLGGKVFRKGDKVMQTKNNYDKDIFNGDIGTIYAIDDDDNALRVQIDGVTHTFDYQEAEDELIHAYCISTHRSQGSEYPIVVMPVMTQHYMMLQRNLLYTAITRAKKMVVLVGTRQALRLAVENNKVAERYSGLLARLR